MSERDEHPMAIAMMWVSRVFAASLMMCLPGLGGRWLDRRWGTSLLGPAGFVLGLVSSVVYLISVTRQAETRRRRNVDAHETSATAGPRNSGPPTPDE